MKVCSGYLLRTFIVLLRRSLSSSHRRWHIVSDVQNSQYRLPIVFGDDLLLHKSAGGALELAVSQRRHVDPTNLSVMMTIFFHALRSHLLSGALCSTNTAVHPCQMVLPSVGSLNVLPSQYFSRQMTMGKQGVGDEENLSPFTEKKSVSW